VHFRVFLIIKIQTRKFKSCFQKIKKASFLGYLCENISKMTFAELNLDQKYTYSDYLKWTFDQAVELIKGKVLPMAAPISNHQEVVGNVFNLFKNELKIKPCKAFIAPFDVRLPKPMAHRKSDSDIETVVQPDVCVICDLSKIDRRGCLGAPDLVVEVVSKSTASRDFNEKKEVYQESGVREYWIVNFEYLLVQVFRLTETGLFEADKRTYTNGDFIKSSVLPDFTVQVDVFFEGIIDFEN
jgi:Uma2 family endonuclease